MPITLPETLPAFDVLSREGVMVMSPERAARQRRNDCTPIVRNGNVVSLECRERPDDNRLLTYRGMQMAFDFINQHHAIDV